MFCTIKKKIILPMCKLLNIFEISLMETWYGSNTYIKLHRRFCPRNNIMLMYTIIWFTVTNYINYTMRMLHKINSNIKIKYYCK